MQTIMTAKEQHIINRQLRFDGLKTGFKSNVLHHLNWQGQLQVQTVTADNLPYVKRYLHAVSLGWYLQKIAIGLIMFLTMEFLVSVPTLGQQHADYLTYEYQVNDAKAHHQTKLLNTTLKRGPQVAWFVKFGHIDQSQYRQQIQATKAAKN